MQRAAALVSALAALLFLVGALRLGQLEAAGPAHQDLWLEGGIPATVYLPGEARGRAAFEDPPQRDARPPVLVLMHGYANDRAWMSSLARRIAASGFAVLAFDAAGHGDNRNPFRRSRAREDSFDAEFSAAVEFLRGWPHADASRIAVGGFSMGAGAALDFASRYAGLDAVVAISGSASLEGPYRPPNALFLVAEGDPERTSRRAHDVAERLAGAPLPAGAETGRHERGDAVRFDVIEGTGHADIVWADATAQQVVSWLDRSFGRPARDAAPPADPRLALLVPLCAAFLLLLPGLGLCVGRLVPAGPERPAEGRLLGLGLLAAGLLLSMPLLAPGTPGRALGLDIGDVLVPQFALAGLGVLVALRLRWPEPLEGLRVPLAASAGGAALAVFAVFALMQVLGPVLHRLGLTPERAVAWLLATAGFLPFSLAACALLRRGSPGAATLAALGGRLLVLLALLLGVRLSLLHPVVLFMVPPFAGVSVLLEVFAASLYAASRNLVAIAVVDAAWFALVVVAVVPMRI